MRNQNEAGLRTERVNRALDPNTQLFNISRSDHDMQSVYSLPPSDEVEVGDGIPRSETTWLLSLSRSSAMSDVARQSSAVADIDGEIERQRHIAEYERQRQENIFNQQLEQAG